jgi:RHS repeat-associated protein
VLTERKKATPAVDELPRTYDADVLSYADYYPFGMEIAHRSESKEHMINYQYQSATLTDFDNPIFTTVSFHEDFTKIANRESNRYVETYNRKYHTRGNPSSGVDRCYYGTGYFEGWTQHMPFSNIPWHELSGTDPADLHNRKLLKYTSECTLPHHGQSHYYSNIWFNNTDVLLIRNWTMYTDETEAILYLGEQNDIGGYDGDGITPGYYEISISMKLNWQNIDINSLDVWYESEDPNVNPVVHATIDFGNTTTNGLTPATLNIVINQHFKKDALHFYFRDDRNYGLLMIRDLYYNIKRFTRYPTYEATIGNYQTAENTGYRYGFNGMEKDDEVKGSGNSYDFGARIQDPRLGIFLSTDPRFRDLPSWSPYSYAVGNPILFIDPDGEFPYTFHVRAFAPPESFVGFGGFHDDGRGFSTSTDAGTTSRIKQNFTVDPTNQSFSKTDPSSDPTKLGPFSRTASPTGDASATFGTNTVGSATASIGSYFEGNNPMVPFSPAISVSSAIAVTENLKENQVIVSIDLSSKAFPATEAFIQDAEGNSVFLIGAAAYGDPGDLYDPKQDVGSFDLRININDEGIFQSVQMGDQTYSLDEFNALGTSQDAGPKPREEKDNQ